MSESEFQERVLRELGELRGEMGEVRIGLGDVRGRLDRLGGEVAGQGSRLNALTGAVAQQGSRLDTLTGEVAQQGSRVDTLTGEVETLGREVRKDLWELPAQLLAGVMAGIERSAYATDLRALQAEVANLKHDVTELKRAAGE